MKMQTGLIAAMGLMGVLSNAVADGFDDYARVLSVTPQMEQFNYPQQECRTEYVTVERQERGVGGSIIGGVAGGILGSQVGGGNGRTAATAAGAIVGAIVGDRMENRHAGYGETRPVQRCHTVDNWQSRVTAYQVTYEYRGHTYTSLMPHDPGRKLRVRVSVTPA